MQWNEVQQCPLLDKKHVSPFLLKRTTARTSAFHHIKLTFPHFFSQVTLLLSERRTVSLLLGTFYRSCNTDNEQDTYSSKQKKTKNLFSKVFKNPKTPKTKPQTIPNRI